MHRNPVWLALALVGCLALPAPGQVLLADIIVQSLGEGTPYGDYYQPETITLQNHGAEPAALMGWSLSVSPGLAGPGSVDSWALPATTALPAGEQLTIYWHADL